MASCRFPQGTTGSQLDALARRPLWEAGLDYDHGTGHGVGSYLGVHEGPQRISKAANTQALLPGMIVSNEPGYYKTGAYGIRIENLVVVTALGGGGEGGKRAAGLRDPDAGAHRPRFGRARLCSTPTEIAWLDAYHARLRKELGPLLDQATRAWLERATRTLSRG